MARKGGDKNVIVSQSFLARNSNRPCAVVGCSLIVIWDTLNFKPAWDKMVTALRDEVSIEEILA